MNPIGRLNQRVTIETPTVTRSEGGGELKDWGMLFVCYAGVDFPRSGNREKENARQLSSKTTTVFVLRREDRNVTAADRVVWHGHVYEIESVSFEGNRQEFIRLDCYANDLQS